MPPGFRCPSPTCGRSVPVPPDGPVICPHCGTPVSPPDGPADTLPLSRGPADTLDLPPAIPDPAADLPARIGRFEVRGWLGEGQFGFVLRAYDPQLDRDAAVKVAKLGTADADDRVRRFLREAKAAAGLRHPHIVPVHEYGRDGATFFIVSEFIAGQSLAARLDGQAAGRPALPVEAAVAVVRKLAEALAYAHGRGVVHRDVKPANILLDAAGEPLLTDFGLATRADGAERQTHAGAVLGTPLYMPPEQARGEACVTGASDQYSLGVVLYELLTGRTPFEGPPQLVLFHHLNTVPDSPRKLVRRLPRDLETICRKCLEKEPERRYADCAAVAEDLRRWQAGEPILARRLSAAERTGRWVRRNPAVAGLLAAVAASLMLGTAVAWVLALEAQASKKVAQENEEKAEENARQVTQAYDELEATLVDSLLQPIGRTDGPLDSIEVAALTKLGSLPNDGTRLRFLETGLRTEESARRLDRRGEWVIQAAVGLDAGRRQQVEALLLRRLEDPNVTDDVKRACIWLGVEMEAEDPRFARWASDRLRAELDTLRGGPPIRDQSYAQQLVRRVGWLTRRLPPAEAVRLLGAAVDQTPFLVAEGVLRTVSGPGGDAGLAGQAAAAILTQLNKSQYVEHDLYLAQQLDRVSRQLAPAAAAEVSGRAADALLAALSKANRPQQRAYLAAALAVVGGRLDPAAAAKAADAILAELSKATYAPLKDDSRLAIRGEAKSLRLTLVRALEEVSRQLAPAAAAEVSGRAADALLAALSKATQPDDRKDLSAALAAVGGRLEQAAAARTADALLAALCAATQTVDRGELAKALAAIIGRLDPAAAATRADRAANALLAALGKATQPWVRQYLLQGLEAVSGRLDLPAAGRVADALLAELNKVTDPSDRWALRRALTVVGRRLDSDTAGRVLLALLADMGRAYRLSSENVMMARSQMDVLAPVASRLDPATAGRVADALLADLNQHPWGDTEHVPAVRLPTGGVGELYLQVQALAVVGGRLDSAAAGRVADALLAALSKATQPTERQELARALAVVGGRLDPAAAAKVVDALLTDLSKTTQPAERQELAKALTVLCGRLDPVAAAARAGRAADALLAAPNSSERVGGYFDTAKAVEVWTRPSSAAAAKAADALLVALKKAPRPGGRGSIASALAAVGGRLDPAAAGKAADALVAELSQGPWEPGRERRALVHALVAVSGGLDPDAAAKVSGRAADALIDDLSETSDVVNRGDLTAALVAVAGRLDPAAASRVADALLAELNEAPHPSHRQNLVRVLKAVSRRMEPTAAGEVSDQAVAAILADLNKRPWDKMEREMLVRALEAVSARLGPDKAGLAADSLVYLASQATGNDEMDTMRWERDLSVPEQLLAVTVVVGGLAPDLTGLTAALAATASQIDDDYSANRLHRVVTALERVSQRLPDERLVALLRHPLAVGRARQALLNECERRTRHRFRGSWHYLDWARANGITVPGAPAAPSAAR